MITDHKSLRTINNKVEQPARILRFLDAIKHYQIRILYRPSKAHVLAYYLSKPPEEMIFPTKEVIDLTNPQQKDPEIREIQQPHQLNSLDLQAIYEYLTLDEKLPEGLEPG
ncbi:Uu.00g115870.m01.CDS01 [Anthostomella pinea]|uniref:Uu.00g115870.m01.CDS01 n=1 Tax=Anthostomella pinea TaxID=933095 RepID=A0AAI8VFU7_9PEZI|nr:Uu.00g115870.m01.CDS01 [Anthostomella pinea]